MFILYAIIGLWVGGLLNVLADDLPLKQGVAGPRCPQCRARRPMATWLVSVGYLVGRRRCDQCAAALPYRYVIVELVTAAAFGFLAFRYGFTGHMLLLSAYIAVLILITVIDLQHRLILNRVIGPAILLALLAGPFTPGLNWKQMLVGGVLGFGLFYLVAIIYPGGMGAGDVKLAAFIGLITGFPVVVVALLVAVLTGGVISLLLVLTRIRSRRDYIPYGPFLVIGAVFALFWGAPLVKDYIDSHSTAESTHVQPLQGNPTPPPFWEEVSAQ
jgi:leader peptidase (prepilin peptidase)/N-methyltransferase